MAPALVSECRKSDSEGIEDDIYKRTKRVDDLNPGVGPLVVAFARG